MARKRRKIVRIKTLEIINVTKGKRKFTKLRNFYKKHKKKRKKEHSNGK